MNQFSEVFNRYVSCLTRSMLLEEVVALLHLDLCLLELDSLLDELVDVFVDENLGGLKALISISLICFIIILLLGIFLDLLDLLTNI